MKRLRLRINVRERLFGEPLFGFDVESEYRSDFEIMDRIRDALKERPCTWYEISTVGDRKDCQGNRYTPEISGNYRYCPSCGKLIKREPG